MERFGIPPRPCPCLASHTASSALQKTSMGDDLEWCYEERFVAEGRSVRMARSFVCQHLLDHRLTYLVAPVRLSVSELATNTIVHGGTAFTVTLWGYEDMVVLGVADDGTSRLDLAALEEGLGISGRGLRIVSVLSHEWGVLTDRPGTRTLWASFLRDRTTRSRGATRAGLKLRRDHQTGMVRRPRVGMVGDMEPPRLP